MSLHTPPVTVDTTIWTRVPDEYRNANSTLSWIAANRPGQSVDCFLEGPSFDRDGNLYMTDIPFGRIFRITPDAQWSLIAEYDGWPNGLKIHRDGRIFITDYKTGIMALDPLRGTLEPVLTHRKSESFRGVNDLFFDRKGLMYFTDQGQTGLHDPSGRVYRYDLESEQLDLLISNGPSHAFVTMARAAVAQPPIVPSAGSTTVSCSSPTRKPAASYASPRRHLASPCSRIKTPE